MKKKILVNMFVLGALFATTHAPASEEFKYFIDTHDRSKGSFPDGKVTDKDFIKKFAEFDQAATDAGMRAYRAHVNVEEGKAYCFTRAKSVADVLKAHEEADLPYDSIIEVRTVDGSDLRY